jgi:hypothetical protein
MVIHDLRLEIGDRVAQIDHLLISRVMDVFVIETKNYSANIEISELGEFIRRDEFGSRGIDSPIEQNNKHVEVIKDAFAKLSSKEKLPTRLGLTLKPKFRNVVLFSASAVIQRPIKFDTLSVMKVDQFRTWIEKDIDSESALNSVVKMAKIVSQETILDLAIRVAAMHKPLQPNYKAKFSLDVEGGAVSSDMKLPTVSSNEDMKLEVVKGNWCAACKVKVTPRVAEFCWNNKTRFSGRVYCVNCQSLSH